VPFQLAVTRLPSGRKAALDSDSNLAIEEAADDWDSINWDFDYTVLTFNRFLHWEAASVP
jgi:hypothetical protein